MSLVGGIIVFLAATPQLIYVAKKSKIVILFVSLIFFLTLLTAPIISEWIFPYFNPSGAWIDGDLNRDNNLTFLTSFWQIGTMFSLMVLFEFYRKYLSKEQKV